MSKRKIMALAVLVVVTAICSAVFIQSKKESEACFHENKEVKIYDPISKEDISENVLTIPEVTEGQENITVIGQVAYSYASNPGGKITNFILQDVIDNKVVGLLVSDDKNTDMYQNGDVVLVTGSVGNYGGVIEFKSVAKVEKVKSEKAFEPQVVTISELKTDSSEYISEYILIKNAKLGAYDAKGNTYVSDGTGEFPIYKGAAFGENIKEGSVVDLTCSYAEYRSASQLRVGCSDDYVLVDKADTTEYNTEKQIDVAKFAGKANYNSKKVYGDLYENNDMLDKTAYVTRSGNGKCSLSGETVKDYVLGANGLLENQYLTINFDTVNVGNLKLKFDLSVTFNACKKYEIYYSVNNKDYVKYTKIGLDKEDVVKTFELDLPKKLNNVKKPSIMIKAVGKNFKDEEANKYNMVRLSNVSIVGCPVKSDKVSDIVEILPQDNEIALNQEISLNCDTEGAEIYYSINDSKYEKYDATKKIIVESLPMKLKVYSKKNGLENSLEIYKKFNQLTVDKVKATPKAGSVKVGKVITLSTSTEDAKIAYSYDKSNWIDYEAGKLVIEKLPTTIYTKATKDGYKDSEISVYNYTEKTDKNYNIYFGQLHSHTNYSDGAGTCEDAYKHASTKAEQIDFLAVTDHSNSFDNADSADILNGSMSNEWVEGHNLAKKYTSKDFVGIFGYEMTWSNGLGHMNTFNTNGFQSRTQADYTKFDTALQNYYTALKKDVNSISQFNHPGTTFGDFQDFSYYSEEMDDLIKLVEVGNGEGAIGSSGYFPSYEYYTRALDKGWHVSPTNNQDNHKGVWGNANTGRSVVLAENLTEEAIYDAMNNYRIYATEDNDLEIRYTLDGYTMGESIDKEDVGSEVSIAVDIKDPTDSAIGKVEVIVNGGLSIATKNVNTAADVVNFTVPSGYSYYYIKITQVDGDIAVTSPVWVGKVEAIGSNGINTNTALAVTNEPIDVNFGMYNNENKDFEVDSVEFSVGDKVVHKVDLEKAKFTKVPSMGEVNYSFNYVHKKVGQAQIKVTVKGKLNGVDKVYTDLLKVTYVSEDMVTNVLVDGTHHNDYVSGYYDGNMGNFTTLAASKNIRVNVEKKKITKKMLDDAQLLVISAPAKKAGSTDAGAYEAEHFDDEFIKLVKSYVDSGKTLIVCGLSDLNDTADGQTSTEMNKLLKGIGATTRINSDQTCDDSKNGGQPYRLYLENFNKTNEVFNGIVDGQVYSQYKGCSLILDSTAVKSGKAQWLVKGFDTTYSMDATDFTKDRVDTSGNIVTMAVEQLNSGAKVYASGAVCLSNFEIKANLDNASDLQYANYTIASNILDSIAKKMKVTPIREVRKANLGDVFTVEGYVTSGTSNANCRFFDAIYVQDDTAGITVFPYAADGLEIGTKIRITGYVDQYQGDTEIQLMSYQILKDAPKKVIEPTLMSAKDSMNYDDFGGMLIKTVGTATNVTYTEDGKGVSQFYIKDKNGNLANIFIDGYILSGTTGKNELANVVKEGQLVSAVGLLYKHPEGSSDVSVPCLRVRNCDEIVSVTNEEAEEMYKIIESEEYKNNIYSNYNDGNKSDNTGNSTDVDSKNTNSNTSSLASKLNSLIKTGDNSKVALYVGIAIIVLGMICVLIVVYKKKQQKNV